MSQVDFTRAPGITIRGMVWAMNDFIMATLTKANTTKARYMAKVGMCGSRMVSRNLIRL